MTTVAIVTPHPIESGSSGDRKRTLELANELTLLGFDVVVVSPDFGLKPILGDTLNDEHRYEVVQVPVFAGRLAALHKRKWQVTSRIWRSVDPFASVRSRVVRRALAAALEALAPNVVDIQHTFLEVSGLRPTVRTVHNVESMSSARTFNWLQKRYVRGVERRTTNEAARVVVFTRDDADRLKLLGVEKAKIVQVAIGVGDAAEGRVARPHVTTIGFIGSFDYQPNLDAGTWLIANAKSLLERTGASKVVLVGRQAARHFTNTPLVEIRSDVADITAAVQDIDILAIPLTGGGGMRVKVIEALRLGLPIVATRIAVEGIDLTNMVDAVIVDSPADVAEGLCGLAQAETRTRMSIAGQSLWRSRYSSRSMAEAISAIYINQLRCETHSTDWDGRKNT